MYQIAKYKVTFLCITFLLGISLSSYGHGGQAFYSFWGNEGKLFLTVSVESHDLSHVLGSQSNQQSLGLQSARYIQEHFTCVISGRQVLPEFSGSVAQKGWTKLEFELEQCVSDIKTFEVETDCFLSHGHSHGHSFINTIEFAFPGQEKSYTLDSDRKKMIASFRDS
jgi:hypothetical protein